MSNNLRIGVRNSDQERERIILNTFNKVKSMIQNKKEFLYNIKIESYKFLKKEFNKNDINNFEKKDKPAINLPKNNEGVILFNNSFFNRKKINQESIFIHEIGHIINQLPVEAKNNENNCLVKCVYKEYLADKYLFEIDKNIFLNGRIIPDINTISINKIKIETSNNKEGDIKGIFITIGRLCYYYSLYEHELIPLKIGELTNLIKEYFPNIDYTLKNIIKLCCQFKSKNYQELEMLLDKTNEDINNLKIGNTINTKP